MLPEDKSCGTLPLISGYGVGRALQLSWRGWDGGGAAAGWMILRLGMDLPRVTGQVKFGGGRKKSQELRGGERVMKTVPWGGGEGWPKGSPFPLRGTVAEAGGIKKGREKAAGRERCFYPPSKHRLRVCLRPVPKGGLRPEGQSLLL